MMRITECRDDARLRASFNALARATFGIDFEAWYQGHHWDDTYTCWAWVEAHEVIATVGLSRLWIQDQEVWQIETVITHPDHRGRGLSTRLMRAALQGRERVFLLAHPGARDYYPRFGFSTCPLWDFWIERPSERAKQASIRPLDPGQGEDMALILAHSARASPLSARCSVRSQALLAWHALNPLRNCFFHVPDLDLVFAGRAEDGTFHLFDVLAQRLPPWHTLASRLPLEGASRIQFHFTPDQLCPEAHAEPSQDDDLLFVKGQPFSSREPFRVPFTVQA